MRPPRLSTRLRAERQGRGLSQERLARLAGISRQSYAAIEAGTSVPSTEVALRLARALWTTVESLFRLPEDRQRVIEVELVGGRPSVASRVRLGRVAGRVHAYGVSGQSGHAWEPADGVARPVSERSEPASGSAAGVTGPEGSQRVRVEVVEERAPECDLVVLGCDPSFALVADQLRRERGVEVLWCQLGSRGALEALAAGQAQVVGVHLYDAGSGEYNAPWVRKLVPFACTIVRFAEWEQELIVHAGNPLQIGGVDDLARPAVRFVNRELGSGSRALLDRRLAEAGVPGEAIPGYASTAAAGHLSVAEAIASGVADAGVALRAAGQAFGLAGIALGRERYDLVVPDHFLDLPAVQALLDVLRSRTLQTQIELLGGYDVSVMGQPS